MRFLLELLLVAQAAYAIRIPFDVHTVPAYHSRNLHPRAVTPIKNQLNAVYITNITLGGRTIPVMLDTGSSDLWVTGDVPNSKDSGKAVKLEYAVGEASGDIFFAPLTFAGVNVTDQAFLLVKNTSTFSTDISAQGYDGLIGLGPNSGSLIMDELDEDGTGGDAVLDRIFQLNQTSQNYITFMLDRKNDPLSTATGQFTIGEPVKGFDNITSAPKLDVIKVPGLTDRDQHWQMYTDVDGVIGPDGQPIKVDSIVPKAPDGQLVAVIDSGFTLPQVPRTMSDAIYGRVQGASWNVANQVWTIPCSQMLNISIKFGGVTFPIHPLDTSSSDFGLTDSSGKPVCVGTFQPITSAFSLLGEYDIILGMGYLRNAYTLIDFGNLVEGTTNDKVKPYVQMIPTTNVNTAHDDFVKVRLNGVDTTGDASQSLLPVDQGQSSPESESEKKAHLAEKVLSRWPYILLGSLLLFFILVGLCIWRCCCRRRIQAKKAEASAAKRTSLLQMGPVGAGSYKPIQEPPPYSAGFHDPYRAAV